MAHNPSESEKVRISQELYGIEGAQHFRMSADEDVENRMQKDASIAFNNHVDEYTAKLNAEMEDIDKRAAAISENINDLEIMPVLNYLIVRPYDQNPYQKIQVSSKSGLIIDMGGQKPTFKNQDNGEVEEEENFIVVGKVIEVGPETKYVREGDDIFFTKPSQTPIPFFKMGLVYVAEPRVMAVVNEKLRARFQRIVEGKLTNAYKKY